MALQAYFDESEEQGKIFVLGGYVSTPEKWEQFSGEWAMLLKKYNLSEFRMRKNAKSFDRASEFYRITQKYVIASICCSVDRGFLNNYVEQMGIPIEYEELKVAIRNPYHWAFKIILADALRHKHKVGLDQPLDIIFDERSDGKKALAAYKYLRYTAPPELLAEIGAEPSFKSSIQCAPLQAADMYAWCVRKSEISEGWVANSYFKNEKPIPEIFIKGGPKELAQEIEFVFSEENRETHKRYVALGN